MSDREARALWREENYIEAFKEDRDKEFTSELLEYPKLVYGDWPGNPRGEKYVPGRCAEEVTPSGTWVSSQCSRPAGHGDRGLFCKQHAKRHPARSES